MASVSDFLAFLPRLPLVQKAVPLTMPGRYLRPRHEQSRVVQVAAYGAGLNRHSVPPKKTKQVLDADTTHNYSVASASDMPT